MLQTQYNYAKKLFQINIPQLLIVRPGLTKHGNFEMFSDPVNIYVFNAIAGY